MHLTLPYEVEALIHERVQAGEYPSAEAVVEEAVRVWVALPAQYRPTARPAELPTSAGLGQSNAMPMSPEEAIRELAEATKGNRLNGLRLRDLIDEGRR